MNNLKSKQKIRYLRKLIWKSYALLCMLTILTTTVGTTQADVTYDVSTVPVIANSSVINSTYQANSSANFSATISAGVDSVEITPAAIISSTHDGSTIYAVFAPPLNTSILTTDILAVTGNAVGSALTSISAQENTTVTAYSLVSDSTVTTIIHGLYAGSTVSLSGNSIYADTGLNKTVQTVQGDIELTFDSSHAGTAVLTAAGTDLYGNAGLFVGTAQYNNVITDGADPSAIGFAALSGTNDIALIVDGTLEDTLSLKADNNSIIASFTGNNATNRLSVTDGEAVNLTSSAGIANRQVNVGVVSGS
ncbi:MAG: hypothetical protein JW943_16055, partial [Deltaproteobacteria bacterium]|nr:hypothetical protein [Deltaproteobacteria bacterium]